MWAVVQTNFQEQILSYCKAWLNFSLLPSSVITLGASMQDACGIFVAVNMLLDKSVWEYLYAY